MIGKSISPVPQFRTFSGFQKLEYMFPATVRLVRKVDFGKKDDS